MTQTSKGATNMTALVDALHDDESLRRNLWIYRFAAQSFDFRPHPSSSGNGKATGSNWKSSSTGVSMTDGANFSWSIRCVAVDSTVIPAYCNPNRKTIRYKGRGLRPSHLPVVPEVPWGSETVCLCAQRPPSQLDQEV